MTDWRTFGLRNLPGMSARTRVEQAPPPIQRIVDEREAASKEPFVGITTNGVAQPGLFRRTNGPRTAPIAEAAQEFLGVLNAEQRARVMFPMDSGEWRTWINVHMNHFRHGVLIEDLPDHGRDAALGVLKAMLSTRGYEQARNIMIINQLIADVSNRPDEFGEWAYFVSVFGDPASGEPWGFQFDGHHLCLNCVVFADQLVMTPTFMGSEPCFIYDGPHAGTRLLEREEQSGLALIRSFDAPLRSRAILRDSILPEHLPPELQNPFDGRMQAGACHDNLVAPYEGVAGRDMSEGQRRLLVGVFDSYIGHLAAGHSDIRMAEVQAHLDDTHFSWFGGTGDDEPFYYRVHSPVVMIEFDHHPGVVFDNVIPTRNHIHTVIRTPNGGDYGADLLRQHHEQFDHSHGRHDTRGHS